MGKVNRVPNPLQDFGQACCACKRPGGLCHRIGIIWSLPVCADCRADRAAAAAVAAADEAELQAYESAEWQAAQQPIRDLERDKGGVQS